MTTCYLCGSVDFLKREGAVRDNPSLQIIECRACGLVTLDSLEHIHGGHYEASGMHGEEQPAIEDWLRRCHSDDVRRFEMLRNSIVNNRVLDFGCGAGGFVLLAQQLTGDIAGVEPERRVRDYWRDKLTVYGDVSEAGSDYDLITAFHVVEHLRDPRATLKTLSRHLSAKGRLIIEVPSASDALLTLYESAPFQRFTYWSQHLFLFDADTLRRICAQAELNVVSVRQFQRYPLSNHLFWLSRGKAGGHQVWEFLDTPELRESYAAALAAIGKCDTLIATVERASH